LLDNISSAVTPAPQLCRLWFVGVMRPFRTFLRTIRLVLRSTCIRFRCYTYSTPQFDSLPFDKPVDKRIYCALSKDKPDKRTSYQFIAT
jgi:hypothetical protein